MVITKIISVQIFSIEQHMEQIIIINEEPDLAMNHFKMTHTFKVQDRLNALISTIIQILTGIIEKVIKIIKISEDIKVINNFIDKHKITILKT